jgi:hypothetical protein
MLMLAVALVSATPAYTQDSKKEPGIPFEGTEVFRFLLSNRGLTALPTVADLEKHPAEDTIVVLFGNRLPRPEALQKFERDGRNLLIASDEPHALPWGLNIHQGHVIQESRHAYQERPECPVIRKLEPDVPAEFHELQRGLATNRPTYLTMSAGPLPPRRWGARIEHATIDTRRTGMVSGPTGSIPYAAFVEPTSSRNGKAIVIAGHGIFTNGMLLQPQTDNFTFAMDCLRWLAPGPDGKPRRYALFMVDGTPATSFDVSLKPPLPAVPMPTVEVVNQVLHGMDREGLFFRILRDLVDVRVAVRLALIILTVGMLFYGAKKVTEGRHHAEKGAMLLVGPYAVPADRAPLVYQRYHSQVASHALGDEARALVRSWFADACGIPPADWDRSSVETPSLEIAGSWWQRRRMRREIGRLVSLAGPRALGRFSWRDLVRLTQSLQNLNVAVREGRLTVAPVEKDTRG